jgi:hypothetical protein
VDSENRVKEETFRVRSNGQGSDILFTIYNESLNLSYSSEINGVLFPQRVSLPLKKHRNISSEGYSAYHPVGFHSPLQIKMAVWRTFFQFAFAGPGVAARCKLKWLFVTLILKKSAPTAITICSGLPPTRSLRRIVSEGKRPLKAVKTL